MTCFAALGEFARIGIHIRRDRPGLDVVDRDAAGPEVTGQPARQAGDRGFRHRVDRQARDRAPGRR